MPAIHRCKTRTQRSLLAPVCSRSAIRNRSRMLLRRGLALAIAIGFAAQPMAVCAQNSDGFQRQSTDRQPTDRQSIPFGQSNATQPSISGELPASPWSRREEGRTMPSQDRDAIDQKGFVRQPGLQYQTNLPTLNPPASKPDSSQPSSGTMRPASVTLMGPILSSNAYANMQRLEQGRVANRASMLQSRGTLQEDTVSSAAKESVPSEIIAAPHRNALTQKTPTGPQPEWHRDDAGGIFLSDPSPRSLPGLPERDLASERAANTPAQAASMAVPFSLEPQIPETASQPLERAASNGPARPRPKLSTKSKMELVATAEVADTTEMADTTEVADTTEMADTTEVADLAEVAEMADLDESVQPTLQQEQTSARKATLAQRVSYELLSSTPYPTSTTPESLEVPIGWGAIEQELRGSLERCDALLKRNAIMSARDEATSGLRRLCSAMDSHRRSLHSGPALEKAFTALREEADFHNLVGGGSFEAISSLVGSHSTDALKGRKLDTVSAEIASQHYRSYARYQFVVAADGHRWAAELLYAYGKTLEKESELDLGRSFRLRSQSVACYQAAIQVSPTQSEAASQLGYVLIHLDRMDEAQIALGVSLQHRPTASAWNNMAELHRRRGDHAEAEYAIQQASAISQTQPEYSAEKPEVTEVDPATFAKYSPMSPTTPGVSTTIGLPAPHGANTGTRTAASPSFFSKIFTK